MQANKGPMKKVVRECCSAQLEASMAFVLFPFCKAFRTLRLESTATMPVGRKTTRENKDKMK